MITPAPNVIIAFEREPIEKLFSQGASSENLLTEISENKDVLLFTTKNNPNFISFSHEIAFGGNTIAVKLSFIDPKGEFESRYMTTRAIDMIAGYSPQEQQGENSNFGVASRNAQQRTELRRSTGPEFDAEWTKEFRKSKAKRKVYIAYGIGNNLKTWAGPLTLVLSDVKITFKGAKKFDCTFIPLPNPISTVDRRGAFNEVANLNLEGLYIETEGRSNKIQFEQLLNVPGGIDSHTTSTDVEGLTVDSNLNSSEFLYTPKGVNKTSMETYAAETRRGSYTDLFGSDYSRAAKISTLIDFHSIIVDVIRSYIKNATGTSNVVVLLPDINYICRYALEELASLEGLAEKNTLSVALKNSRKENPSGSLNTAPLDDIVMYYGLNDTLGFTYDTIKRILNNFCLTFDSQLKEDYANINPRAIGIPGSLIQANEELPWLDTEYLKVLAAREGISIEQARINKINNISSWQRKQARFILLRDFYASIAAGSGGGLPNHTDTLKKIINKINKSAKGVYSVQWGVFYETNTTVIDYWNQYKDHSLFGGEQLLDPNEPVLVCGDKALIKNFLYAGEKLEKLKAQAEGLNELADTVSTITEEEITARYDQNLSEIEDKAESLGNTNDFYVASGAVETATEKQAALYQSYNQQAFLKIPLHSTDMLLLGSQSYNTGLRRILYPPKEELIGAFGSISYIPDEFAQVTEGAYPEEFKDQLVGADIPVFRFNTKNPNILDLKFDFGALYFAFLEQGYSHEVSRKASAILAGTIDSKYGTFAFPSQGAAIGYIINRQKALGSGSAATDQIIGEVAARYELDDTVANPMEALRLAHAAYQERLDAPNSSIIKIEQLMPGDPLTTTAEFTEQLYRAALQMSIKTLPTFHLSNMSVLTSLCLILAQDPPVGNLPGYQDQYETYEGANGVSRRKVSKRTSLLNTFMSGLYKIVGAKHVISGGDAYSQFKLVKNVVDTSPEPTETDRDRQLQEITSQGIKEVVEE
jgi:hypothetical protein